jgi:hypothetical protein
MSHHFPASPLQVECNRKENVIKVILLVNGTGANPVSYRPDADESQWWSRRDALVRCVAAYLFCYDTITHGNSTSDHHRCSSSRSSNNRKELILIFDEDWSTISMTYKQQPPPKQEQEQQLIPTERTIIQLWKRVTKTPGIYVEQNGLSCLCTIQKSGTTTHRTNPVSVDVGSKRDLLVYLQGTCSMEFLRHHKYVQQFQKFFLSTIL